jgi:Ran GTPase-activating protein (RanGAP) involved in mRNA processing and transport
MELDEVLRDLQSNTILTVLDLCGKGIGAEGARTLAGALKGNTTLITLKLCYSGIGAEGARALADALKGNTTLNGLTLWQNSIGTEGAKALAEALQGNAMLVTLDLGSNNIGAEGARALVVALKDSVNLLSAGDVGGLKKVCAENRKIALLLLEKTRQGDEYLTRADIEAIKRRFPSVSVVAMEEFGVNRADELLGRIREIISDHEWSELAHLIHHPASSIKDLLREATEVQEGRRAPAGKRSIPLPVP